MKLWGGRFEKSLDGQAEQFGASISFDQRLYKEDIRGSIALVQMLAHQKIVSEADAIKIVEGLEVIREQIETGNFEFRLDREDIHLNIEAALHDLIGEVAGRLHTGRSRNDQVALDMRLYARQAIVQTVQAITELQAVLLQQATSWQNIIMPGYTHLQTAQPILLAHHMLAYFEMLQRDAERFQDAYKRTNVSPLGSGALAGLPYPLDRNLVAKQLGFEAISRNSLDAVSDRDFVVEYLADAALCVVHLSRFAEEIILWNTAEFGFVELDDAFTTGSSIMPQKKNPDMAELVRGKSGRMIGHLTAMLVMLKGLPLAYNKDMQEDKESFFDAADTLLNCLKIFRDMLASTRPNEARMRQAAKHAFSTATDYADFLVGKGLPFRQAHEVVGRLVGYALAHKKTFEELSLEELKSFSALFDEATLQISVESSVASRSTDGGTAPAQVQVALQNSQVLLEQTQTWLASKTL